MKTCAELAKQHLLHRFTCPRPSGQRQLLFLGGQVLLATYIHCQLAAADRQRSSLAEPEPSKLPVAPWAGLLSGTVLSGPRVQRGVVRTQKLTRVQWRAPEALPAVCATKGLCGANGGVLL